MSSRKSKSTQVVKQNILSDFTGSCRICMRKSDKMKDLFLTGTKFVEDIQFCTGILITKNIDLLPSSICEDCITQLNISLKFRNNCISSEASFQSLLKLEVKTEDSPNGTAVKEEIEDIYDDNTDYGDEVVEDLKDVIDFVIKKLPKDTKLSKTKTSQVKYRSLICVPCKLVFKTKQESQEHYRKIHNIYEKLVCEVCGKQFIHASSHYSHLRSHREPQHACAHCDYKTTNKADLVKHIRVHTGEKKYQCHVCPSSFRTSSNLSGHITRNHGGHKKHACNRCDKTFFTLNRLGRHMDSHNNIKRYECEFCHSSFTRRCYWKLHLQKKHAVITPPLRPGRRRTNIITDTPNLLK